MLCVVDGWIGLGDVRYEPSILPNVICRTAFAFRPPRLVTTGVWASRVYVEKVEERGLLLPLLLGLGELSIRRGEPRYCWRARRL
jgi:hypothetical protein